MSGKAGAATEISLAEALAPLVTMAILLAAGSTQMELAPPLLITAMLSAAAVAGLSAIRRGHSWEEIQRCTGEKFASVLPAVLILLSIGMLIGSWVLSGTIPLLVVWGLAVIQPGYLVLTAFLITALMSLCTGTSWGSAGTVGVALMGMAVALDAPMGATAGAVVSGAYFGDKLSPLSDSTNVCALGAGARLYDHIRNMLYTAIPSALIAILVYWAAGGVATTDGSLPPEATRLLAELEAVYTLGWAALVPLVVVLGGVVTGRPPALTMVASSIVAVAVGVTVQGFSVPSGLVALITGFRIEMVEQLGTDPASVGPLLESLLNRGGLFSMAQTLIFIISAFLLAAGMDVSGALHKIVHSMLDRVRSTLGLVSASMASGGLLIGLTSHGSVTALIVGNLFQQPYRDHGLAPENLSRSLEDSVTITEPLMPWTVSAVFMATTLGVSTVSYLPWALFCLTGPVFSLLYAATFDRTRFGLKLLNEGS